MPALAGSFDVGPLRSCPLGFAAIGVGAVVPLREPPFPACVALGRVVDAGLGGLVGTRRHAGSAADVGLLAKA